MSGVPRAISLSEPGLGPVAEERADAGVLVPWETLGYRAEAKAAAEQGGWFDLSHWQAAEIVGPGERDFLQRLTTWDAKSATNGHAYRGAILSGRAHGVALGWFLPDAGRSRFFAAPPQGKAAAEHLEMMHFAEELTIRDASEDWALGALVLSAKSDAFFRSLAGAEPLAVTDGPNGVRWWRDELQTHLAWFLVRRSEALAFFRALPVPRLGHRLFEFHRISHAIPEIGKELTGKEIFLEGNFDRAIARNKGCYPGQEVIERIFTYGQVNRRLVAVVVENAPVPVPLPSSVTVEGKAESVGSLVALAADPENDCRYVGLAFLHKSVPVGAAGLFVAGSVPITFRH